MNAILEVDTIGSVRLSKAVNSMLSNCQGGVIINISFTPAISGHFEGAPYTMAKAGVMELTKHVAREYGSNNIRAYILMLGNIATEATYKLYDRRRKAERCTGGCYERMGKTRGGSKSSGVCSE